MPHSEIKSRQRRNDKATQWGMSPGTHCTIPVPYHSCRVTATHFTSRPWWRHQMETFSASLAICAGNSPVAGEFPAQRPVTRGFGVFFDLRLNKRLSKQSWRWWFDTPSCPLWRHCHAVPIDDNYWYSISKWVAVPCLNDRISVCSTSNGHQGDIHYLFGAFRSYCSYRSCYESSRFISMIKFQSLRYSQITHEIWSLLQTGINRSKMASDFLFLFSCLVKVLAN